MPNQPVEDGGGPIRAPAGRARPASAPVGDEPAVLVVTGPSGAGKGTLIKRLLARRPDLELAVSATTRERRPGETDGLHYWFVTDAEFDRKLEAGELLEWIAFPWGQRSATLNSEIDRITGKGRVAVLELEIEGALRAKRRVPGSVTIFVDAPLEELERRLRERATESAGEIGERLGLAREQKLKAGEFHYVVVNDDVERATAELERIVDEEIGARRAPAAASRAIDR